MANPVSETAAGPAGIVAVEQYLPEEQRLVHDDLAHHFLSARDRFLWRLVRWRPARDLLINLSEKSGRGIWGSTLCRKRYIDEKIHEAMGQFDALVNLGAGLDTRPYRLPGLAQVPVFEVDLPENIAHKRARLLHLYGRVPEHVRLVPIDLERESPEAALRRNGYRAGQKTFFIWEAVTQYLTERAVRRVFGYLAQAASGSRLVFTYVRQDFIDGTHLYEAEPLYQRFRVRQPLWRFGMAPEQVGAFLAEYGWQALEQMGSQEFSERYLRPSGRELSLTGMERCVYAGRT